MLSCFCGFIFDDSLSNADHECLDLCVRKCATIDKRVSGDCFFSQQH